MAQRRVIILGMLTLERIQNAHRFLSGRIRKTPVEPSPELSQRLGAPVWLKLELLQLTGSFKIRGAWWRLQQATPEERSRGVATCSAGNHGKAIAFAARELGVHAVVFVPKAVDEAKYRGILALGAEVRRSEFWGYDETEVWAKEQAEKEGMPFISAFDDFDVMAGNGGSLALEIQEQIPEVRNWIIPVGGGGLGAGLAFTVKHGDARVIACQHEASPALRLSLDRGEAITELPAVVTLAGGVEGGIGRHTFSILKDRVDEVALVDEDEIKSATRWMVAQHQYLVEPTAAVTLAACLRGRVGKLQGPAVVVVCGRNVSLKTAMACL
jgi:threonine dehydratase